MLLQSDYTMHSNHGSSSVVGISGSGCGGNGRMSLKSSALRSSMGQSSRHIVTGVLDEINSRRRQLTTYTEPLDCDFDEHADAFVREFYDVEDGIFSYAQDIQSIIQENPDTVATYYKDLVPMTISYDQFWLRYFFKCSVTTVTRELKEQQQPFISYKGSGSMSNLRDAFKRSISGMLQSDLLGGSVRNLNGTASLATQPLSTTAIDMNTGIANRRLLMSRTASIRNSSSSRSSLNLLDQQKIENDDTFCDIPKGNTSPSMKPVYCNGAASVDIQLSSTTASDTNTGIANRRLLMSRTASIRNSSSSLSTGSLLDQTISDNENTFCDIPTRGNSVPSMKLKSKTLNLQINRDD